MGAEGWSALFLGVIALSTATLAVGAAVAVIRGVRTVRRLEQTVADLQAEVRPLLARATAVTEEAARITALVGRQVERADDVLGEVGARLEELVTLVQTAIVRPARELVAVAAAVRAVIEALRGFWRRPGEAGRADEEEALFIG